ADVDGGGYTASSRADGGERGGRAGRVVRGRDRGVRRRSGRVCRRAEIGQSHAEAIAHRSAAVQRDRKRVFGRDPSLRAFVAGGDVAAAHAGGDRQAVQGNARGAPVVGRPAARAGRREFSGEGDGFSRRDGRSRAVRT